MPQCSLSDHRAVCGMPYRDCLLPRWGINFVPLMNEEVIAIVNEDDVDSRQVVSKTAIPCDERCKLLKVELDGSSADDVGASAE